MLGLPALAMREAGIIFGAGKERKWPSMLVVNAFVFEPVVSRPSRKETSIIYIYIILCV